MGDAVRITLIDDDEGIRELISELLAGEGYSVSAYANGQDALEGLRKGERPRMILCDLMMPVMDGWQFLEARKKQRGDHEDIPVVVISATPDEGALGHICVREIMEKPFDVESLLEVVGRYCRPSPDWHRAVAGK